MEKVKNFFAKIKPSKRRLIQLYAALLYNANLKGFITGNISTSSTKKICLPGMNCYSCPGAIGACPLGSLQNALSESKTKAPTYVIGIILLYCIIFGRWICGWLCPGGFLQELLYKIKTPKLQKNRVTRILSYFKYVLLIVFVIMIPIMFGWESGKAIPGFCKYICPIGTFEGAVFLLSNGNNTNYFEMLGPLFTWKFALLVGFIVASIFIYRFFCRFFCPLGAIYGIFNKISILGIKVDKSKCNNCGSCVSHCKMDVKVVGDHECIQCGECIDVCHANAIDWKAIGALIKKENLELEKTKCNLEANNQDAILSSETIQINNAESNKDLKDDINITNDSKWNKLKTKLKSIKKKTWVNGIVTVLLLGILIFAYLYYNIDWNPKTQISIGNKVENINVTLSDDSKYDLNNEKNKVKVLYFFDNYNEEEIKALEEQFKDMDKVSVIAISNYSNRVLNQQQFPSDTFIKFGYDDNDNSTLKKFSSNTYYKNYYVWIDIDNNLRYASSYDLKNEVISIKGLLDGLIIGKNIGNTVISKEIATISKDGKIESFNINEHRGKIVIINFWATWCGPCVQELPYFEQIYEEYKDKLEVIAIHDGGTYDKDSTLEFINEELRKNYGITWAYDDEDGSYFKSLGGGDTLPMTVIVDENGIITYNSPKSVTYESLKMEIDKILNK